MNWPMNSMDTPLLGLLERSLDVAAFRQALIASNLANVDTPGYRTRDLDFRSELRRAALAAGSAEWTPRVREVPGLIERPDGNNVSLEREGLLLAQIQLQFRASAELVRAELRRLLLAINEGR